ncbi:MAG: hypothetical protein C0410_00700 [Anaerolinea sp.]|nr:hypothetical protein [Anaerolinea sp.]
MFKKALWVFVGIYTVVILYLGIAAMIWPDSAGFSWNLVLSIVLMLLPAGVIAFELLGKKVPFIIILLPFLLIAVFFLGIINFNSLSFETVAKAVLFGVTLLILGYMGVMRIRKR